MVLSWDGIARIVPEHYRPQVGDSDVVRELSRSEFIRDLAPSPGLLNAVGAPFMELIRDRGDELRRHYQVKLQGNQAIMTDGDVTRTEILAPKLAADLDDALRQTRLAVEGEPDSSGLVAMYMHPKLAEVYLSALADGLSRAQHLHPVSNEPVQHLAMGGLTIERLGQALLGLEPKPLSAREVETAMTVLTLETVLPRGLSHVPVETLLTFRQKHRDELSVLQTFIEGLAGPGGSLDLPGSTTRTPWRCTFAARTTGKSRRSSRNSGTPSGRSALMPWPLP